ncbi:MAG: CHC2 zinc finger domain-containing protein, partial [Acidaminococcus sp.]|nr:CHC2 zinc finger domain-containing protein [Acidaminococcus sp.]
MAKGFDTNWLDELKYKNDIVEVISRYIPLQKKGSKYFGCCPFHHEKTASFCVNSGEQFYHCFGCGVSGDVIKFIREMESVDFMDACKILADRVGMILPDFQGDAEYQKNKDEKTRLTTLMREAARYYYSVLTHKERGQKAREYLFSRGINEEFMKQYGFGLSDSDRGVVLYLNQKGYTENEMRDCGLIEGERNPIDAFRGRIIVPIFNSMG